jgi:glycerol uptake facilitator-like aquaporin
MKLSLSARLTAEFLGTAFLLAAVVGSGIMGERLAGGNPAFALLVGTLGTVAMLVVLILALLPVSGAHFNPAVTLALAWAGNFSWRQAPAYLAAQCTGAFAGVAGAHSLFGMPLFSLATHPRQGAAQWWSELGATFGLLCVVWACLRFRRSMIAYAVGVYVAAASWFTPSTCFANPALTLARSASDTLAGIRPADVPPFVVAQLLGALAATVLFRRWVSEPSDSVELGEVVAESEWD